MCLIVFSWQSSSETPLLLLGNRDEIYQRPTKQAHWWEDYPEVYGGKDILAGGTWLGYNKHGRIATITNYREPDSTRYDLSRGLIVKDYLTTKLSTTDFLKQLENSQDGYAGFNLLLFEGNTGFYASNRHPDFQVELTPGIYGLSNHLLDTSWPKVKRAKSGFSKLLANGSAPEEYFELFRNREIANDEELPSTGITLHSERSLSAIFIQLKHYGTRSTTLLSQNQNGEITLTEKVYTADSK